ncbi:MAG: hypothetical protein KJO08_08420 [Gammaproteobacteria bacterium]|nr:hypothetical protein [Gammaproteobacteria bacterium]NNJ84060.1 hypothetical protein [Gammaproteobacteria bacterium]
MKTYLTKFPCTALAGLLLVAPIPGNATSLDRQSVCMATKCNGEISLAIENHTQPLKNFMTLRNGDRLLLNQGSELVLVCFEAPETPGRMETWLGPAALTIDEKGAHSSEKQAAELRILPKTPNVDRYVVAVEDQPTMRLPSQPIAGKDGMGEPVDNDSLLSWQTPVANYSPFSGSHSGNALGIFDNWQTQMVQAASKDNCWVARLRTGLGELLSRISPINHD